MRRPDTGPISHGAGASPEAHQSPRVLSDGEDERRDRLASWRFKRTVYRGLALDHAMTGAIIAVASLLFWAGILWLCYKMLMR